MDKQKILAPIKHLWHSMQQVTGRLLIPLTLSATVTLGVLIYTKTKESIKADKAQYVNQEKRFLDVLRTFLSRSETGAPDKYIDELIHLNPEKLSEESHYQWMLTLGKLYLQKATAKEDGYDERILETARRHFVRCQDLRPDSISPFEVTRQLAQTAQVENHPHQIIRIIEQSELGKMSQSERNILSYEVAKSYNQIGNTLEAGKVLDRELAQHESGNLDPTFINLYMLKAELKLSALRHYYRINRRRVDLPLPKSLLKTLKEGYTLLTTTYGMILPSDPRKVTTLNRLIEMDLIDNRLDDAYTKLKLTERLPTTPREKVRSLILLSELEERNANFKATLKPLQLALRDFPFESEELGVFKRLYELYIRRENWPLAAYSMHKWSQFINNREEAEAFLYELLPNIPGNFIDSLSDGEPPLKLYRDLSRTLESFTEQLEARWLTLQENTVFAKAYLQYLQGNYKETALLLNEYITSNLDEEFLETALYLDLKCGENQQAEAPVLVYRAERYLQKYPEGQYRKEVLSTLMQAEMKLGFFKEAIITAKLSFIDQIVSIGKNESPEVQQQWLNTILVTARCNYYLGNYNQANQQFRNLGTNLNKLEPDLSTILDWSNTALKMNQKYEAARRLTISLRESMPEFDKKYLQLAQELLLLNEENTIIADNFISTLNTLFELATQNGKQAQILTEQLTRDYINKMRSLKPQKMWSLLNDLPNAYHAEKWYAVEVLGVLNQLLSDGVPSNLVADQLSELIESVGTGENRELLQNRLDELRRLDQLSAVINELKQ